MRVSLTHGIEHAVVITTGPWTADTLTTLVAAARIVESIDTGAHEGRP
jgi:hypothetical protein